MTVTLRQLEYFAALAETRHFGKAAARVNISQPALSAQIADLESRLGAPLFERTRSGAILTEAGRRALPRALRVLTEARALEDDARQARGLLAGEFRLGVIPTIAPYLIPALLPALRAQFPDLRLTLREAITETLTEDVIEGRLDGVIAAAPIYEPSLTATPLFRDRFYLVVAADEEQAPSAPVRPGSSALDRLLLLEEGHCLRDQALAVCDLAGERRLAEFGATSLATLLQMVSHGLGRTLLPEIALPAETAAHPALRVLPFAKPAPAREIAFFHRKLSAMQPDAQALATIAAATAKDLLRGGDAG